MSTFAKRLVVLGLIVVLIVVLWFFTPLGDLVDFQALFDNRDALLETVQARILLSSAIFIGVYIVATALSLPGATVLTLLGGFFFGPWVATILVNVGATLGAFAIFLAARFSWGMESKRSMGKNWQSLTKKLKRMGPITCSLFDWCQCFPSSL